MLGNPKTVRRTFPDSCLIVFAKAPEPGKVKTRLQPAIGAAQAAKFQTRLLFETLDRVHQRRLCPVQLWCSPTTKHPVFQNASKLYPISLRTQVGTDLGDRMERAISINLETSSAVVLIGCDCPSLTQKDLIDVLRALHHGSDVVLGPAEDGGYVLVGMKKPLPELFRNMRWGTAGVLSETRYRIRRLELQCFETRLQWDIDRPEDLERYLLSGASKNQMSQTETPH
ncbi:MAG: TIGR04282 family arsenosugar biosynthesis glycosyltransferase [Methylococcaceae bacterium]|nr:TIGR04282 family arsenosugar biosynthesis glycosyltransferase [Methylococcaceae bacterium]